MDKAYAIEHVEYVYDNQGLYGTTAYFKLFKQNISIALINTATKLCCVNNELVPYL